MRRIFLAVAGAVAIAQWVGTPERPIPAALAAPEIDSDTFTLAQINDTQTIYTTSVTPDFVGLTVTVASGLCQVEHLVAGNWVALGTLPSGTSSVFEGEYVTVRVKASVASTTGSYSSRGPTDNYGDADYLIGGSDASPGSSPLKVFATTSQNDRTVFLTVSSGQVSLRATSTGADLITVPAGTRGFYQGDLAAAWVVGPGTAQFSIMETVAEGTWIPLPSQHWPDTFSPLWFDIAGVVARGNPLAAEDTQVHQTRQVWDDLNEEYDDVEYVDNEILVGFVPTASANTISTLLDALDLEIRNAAFYPNVSTPNAGMSWFHLRILPTSEYFEDVDGLIEYLEEEEEIVDFAEHNDILEYATDWPPENTEDKDTYYDDQFELSWLGADLTALEEDGAWDTETGNGMCVVLIDSGVSTEHEDLTNRIYTHSYGGDSTARELGVVVKKNNATVVGRIDKDALLRGADTNNSAHGHGTAMAGIICAQPYNDVGVSGCGPDLRVMSVRLDKLSKASVTTAIDTLTRFFPDDRFDEVRVVNMSFKIFQSNKQKPPEKNSMGKAILADLASNNRLYVAAAGQPKNGSDGKEKRTYPASWSMVLGVTGAASTVQDPIFDGDTDVRNAHSNYYCGSGDDSTPDLTVYGVSAYYEWHYTTDYVGTEFGYNNSDDGLHPDQAGNYHNPATGTSCATAQVSALAALLYGKAKRNSWTKSYQQIDAHIKQNVKSEPLEFDAGNDTKAIPGVVDFKAAVENLAQ